MSQSPFGYVVFRRNGLDEHNDKLRSRGVMFLQDAAGAVSFAAKYPQTQVAYRQVTKTNGIVEAQLHRHPGLTLKHAQERCAEVPAHIWVNVGCEPVTDLAADVADLARETLAVAKWAVANKRRVVLLHLAHYGFTRTQWLQLAELMRYASGKSQDASGKTINHRDYIIIGLDEYGAVHTFSGVVDTRYSNPDNERGHINPSHWKASDVGRYYHCGRVWDLLNVLTELGIPWPRIWITEHGLDALGDVTAWRKSHTPNHPYDDIRGWKSCQNALNDYYNNPASPHNRGWLPARAYGEMVVATHREIYQPTFNPQTLAGVEVVLIYGWRWLEDPAWEQFDVSEATSFQVVLENYRPFGGSLPMPTYPPPVNKPAVTPVDRISVATRNYVSINIRSGPGTNYEPIGELRAETRLKLYQPPEPKIANGYHWVYIEPETGKPGWVSDLMEYRPEYPAWLLAANWLRAPFLTQRNTGRNNCGPAVGAMYINYHRQGYGTTVEAVDDKTLDNDDFVSFGYLETAIQTFGPPVQYQRDVTLAQLTELIDGDRPSITLVKRGLLDNSYGNFDGNHFALVVGYSPTHVILHDPLGERYGRGYFAQFPNDQFMSAFNALGAQALLAEDPVPKEPPPDSDWMDALTDRERHEVELAQYYATHLAHGTDGHHRLLLIAKLADLLTERV